MLRIFRKNKKKPGEVQDVQPRPAEQSGQDLLEQRLEDTRKQLATRSGALLSKRSPIDEELLGAIETTLITSDIGVQAALEITANLQAAISNKVITEPGQVLPAVQAELFELIEPCEQFLHVNEKHKPFVILMVGVNGAGKTTTIGKLARRFRDEGYSVMLAAGDTFRAAAVDQLKIWGERTGCPVIAKEPGADAAGLAFEALERARRDGADLLLIDTAGRLQNRDDLMGELSKIIRVLRKQDEAAPHSCLLVLDATVGQNAHSQVETFKQMADVTGLVVTKLDGTARGGVLIALAEKFSLPVHAIGVGEGADDLQPFEAAAFARNLMGLPDGSQ